ncbi:hypothetical protein Dda_5194 [Drechslerella dactyloides]|uniref:Uncharacterized protein n=1 Tax=Drechslerella dactyloides TaxID=74499 RepID=A0AAD6J027_DREDA|nr:hypothetical protein Dda_5194 [Drechslerella dactyloides]
MSATRADRPETMEMLTMMTCRRAQQMSRRGGIHERGAGRRRYAVGKQLVGRDEEAPADQDIAPELQMDVDAAATCCGGKAQVSVSPAFEEQEKEKEDEDEGRRRRGRTEGNKQPAASGRRYPDIARSLQELTRGKRGGV